MASHRLGRGGLSSSLTSNRENNRDTGSATRGGPGSATSQSAPHRKQRQPRQTQNSPTEQTTPDPEDKVTNTTTKSQRKGKSNENEHVKPRKEDLENQKTSRKTRSYNRGAKKKVLEEANNSKLRQNLQVRVEDCLQNGQKLSTICRLDQEERQQTKITKNKQEETRTIPEEIKEDITEELSNASTTETNTKSPTLTDDIKTTPEKVSKKDTNKKEVETQIKSETKIIEKQRELRKSTTPEIVKRKKEIKEELPRTRASSNAEKRRRRSSKEVETSTKARSSLKEEIKCEELVKVTTPLRQSPVKEIEEIIPQQEQRIKEEFPEESSVELPEDKVIESLEESGIIEDLREDIVTTKETITQEIESEEDDCVIVEEKESSSDIPSGTKLVEHSLRNKEVVVAEGNIVVSVREDDEGLLSSPFGRMELGEVPGTQLLRFPDDRSDSGVSSLRSGSCASGDERSGSRSSALSSSDEPQQQQQQLQDSQQQNNSNSNNNNSSRHDFRILSSSSATDPQTTIRQSVPQSNSVQTTGVSQTTVPVSTSSEKVHVWRDPSLILESEPSVRHIHSVQHQSLLMSHVPPVSSSAAGNAAAAAALVGHYPPPPPPLITHPHLPPHALPPHLAPPPALYSQLPHEVLWKQHTRYPPLPPVGAHLLGPAGAAPSAEELLDRERAYNQDRERILRDRREQEVREMEKQREKEREKERERLERERERQEREKVEREREREREKERAERERQERFERDQERERQEKQRAAEQAVHKHFEESLRLAHQKRERSWNQFNLPPPSRNTSSSIEDDRKRLEEHQRQEQHRQMQARERERVYHYAMNQAQRPPSVPSKADYPPPAHSRVTSNSKNVTEKISTNHPALPKAEPNFNLFNYPAYQSGFVPHDQKMKMEHHKSQNPSLTINKTSNSQLTMDSRDRDMVRTSPSHHTQLMNEMKNSVIVKHEVKSPHNYEKSNVAHSPSPKLRDMQHYMQSTISQGAPKGSIYEYRSPTQSPHHLQHPHVASPHHHQIEAQKSHSSSHHRSSSQLPSPHAHQRQSPHLSTDTRYTRSDTQLMYPSVKSTVASSYPYMPPIVTSASHYAMQVANNAASKPKVSSSAPPHMYGKPNAGIVSGIPVSRVQEQVQAPPSNPIQLIAKLPLSSSVSPSPYQQVSQYHPPHHHQPSNQSLAPPPAHSSKPTCIDRPLYDRMYPGPPNLSGNVPGGLSAKPLLPPSHHGTSPPTAASAPSPISRSPHQVHLGPIGGHQQIRDVQTQPLDLGVSSQARDIENSSPKRKGTPVSQIGGPIALDVKKRRVESPMGRVSPMANIGSPHNLCTGPQLARVSEPSPLIASAATTITTVVNTAALRPPGVATPLEGSQESATKVIECSEPVNVSTPPVSINSTSIALNSPAPSPKVICSAPSPKVEPTLLEAPSTPIKSLTPSVVDSEKSNSPGPPKTNSSNYPVRHLKKAWLQRHTGEDVEDTTGAIGSGSCVTLPIPNVNTSNSSSNSTSSNISSSNKEVLSTVNLHTVGSMAINSVAKKSLTGKNNARKNIPKESGTVNGHGGNDPKNDDSSSSDQERGRKSPPKRKPPKVKRKKGGGVKGKPTTEDLKKRKPTGAQPSESASDSDKESGSEKDSDSGTSTQTVKKAANGNNTSTNTTGKNDKEPRKRGRRPKSSKNDRGEEPRNKKSRENEPSLPQRDPFRKPPVGQLKKTGESFLQDGPCFEVAPKLAKCRECRWTPNQRSKNMPNIFCRFYAFRRLRYTKNGQLAIAGFSDPHKDATEDDLKLWLPLPENPPSDLDLEMSRLLLMQVGDHFCDLLVQEKEAIAEHMSDDKTIAWKRVVQGVREMCDVCETTLFNFHWACGKCGFVVCLDCYKGRKMGSIKIWGESRKDRDDCSWLLCTNRQAHEQEKLMLTQIIAGDSLTKLGKKVHEYRDLWGIPQFCGCPLSKDAKTTNEAYKDIIKGLLKGEINGIKTEKKEEGDEKPLVNGSNVKEEKNSALNWLADVALSSKDKKNDDSSDSDCDKEGNFSTLRELLIRPSHKTNGSGANSPSNNSNNNGITKPAKKSRMEALDEVISSVIEDTVQKDDISDKTNDIKAVELKHFLRKYNWKGRDPIPIRIMTLTESKILYPDIPHSWLCDGKLLRLLDSNHAGNYRVFQDQWKRGQPVIVSDVTKSLDHEHWHPNAFIKDFGDEKNDLINCMTGNLVPNQPMRKFWEGFEHFSKRLKDERGNPMLLKLKDWPPGEDFAELMPTRFNDLMRVLPMNEYTHRSGRLNLASRLPECFVRPDLGPKMYNAYGSALHPTKGTTNLHLDISDAVNVMVYVGIPKDGDNDEHIKEAFRAIDEAGCDILTRRRVRDKGELPGALWHIYNARDADKIRDLLNKVAIEKGARLEPHHDPIHDQSHYLDGPLRERLYKEYGVEGYAIVQCLGDAVFIPAGAPHQVRNLHNCIKVAEDFVSPENVSHCFHLTQEFRELSDTHTNHEDKLQIKNIIYHAVKDSLSALSSLLNNHLKVKEEFTIKKEPSENENSASSSSENSNSANSPQSVQNQDTDNSNKDLNV